MANVTKKDLVGAVAEKAGVTKAQAAKAVNAFVDTIIGSMKKKKKVTLIGFGTFSVRQRKARKGINPKTKETIKIPAKKVPHFSASKKFKDLIAKK